MTTPQTEVTPVVEKPSVEDRLEATFKRAEKAPEPEAQEQPEEEEETEAESPDEGNEEAEGQSDPETPVDEEVEFEGKAYKVPKELKDALLREKDYRTKTQEIADIRRRTETQMEFLEKSAKIQSVAFDKAVELRNIDGQLEQYSQLNWNQLADENPTEFLKLDRQYRQLAEMRTRTLGELQQIAQQSDAAQQEHTAKQLENAQKELMRRLPKLDGEAKKQIAETALNAYGFTPKELEGLIDPRHVHVLHDAMMWRKLQAQKPAIQKKVTDAKPMQISGRSSQNSQANSDIAKSREALRKSGKVGDAEAYFERMFSKRKK